MSPTYELPESFKRDYEGLLSVERDRFKKASRSFREALRVAEEDHTLPDSPRSLRVKPMKGWSNVFEMTWEREDGRATYPYGPEVKPGKRHIM